MYARSAPATLLTNENRASEFQNHKRIASSSELRMREPGSAPSYSLYVSTSMQVRCREARILWEGVATAPVPVKAFWGNGGAMEAASASSDVWQYGGLLQGYEQTPGCRGCRSSKPGCSTVSMDGHPNARN